nr:hypothetical protein [uncultured Flavobacterium sp.]
MNLIKRAKAPTPKFFRVLRTIGLALAAVGGTLLAAPVALPVAITAAAGYFAVAGGVISAVSQLTTEIPVTPSPLTPEEGTKVDSEEGQKNIRDGD